jgi:hypothetical protein
MSVEENKALVLKYLEPGYAGKREKWIKWVQRADHPAEKFEKGIRIAFS